MYVIKMGGAEGVGLEPVADDLASCWRDGQRFVLVHGGSAETNRLAEEVGHPPQFVTSVSGHVSRRTDARTLELFLMATALVNRRLVAALVARGVRAVGLSGVDGGLLLARRKAALRVVVDGRQRVIRDDWTGRPEAVHRPLLDLLLASGYLPVVAPVALGRSGEPLNVDGDRAAALIATVLDAGTLIFLTNVPGLLARLPDEESLIRHVPRDQLDARFDIARGRMKKKLLGAKEALEQGVDRVIIADGRRPAPVNAALRGIGTLIGAPLPTGRMEARS